MVNVPITVFGGLPFEIVSQYGPPATTGTGVATTVSTGAGVSTGFDSGASSFESACGFTTTSVAVLLAAGEGGGVVVGVGVADGVALNAGEAVTVDVASLAATTRRTGDASRL
jgi:hypothetical protein